MSAKSETNFWNLSHNNNASVCPSINCEQFRWTLHLSTSLTSEEQLRVTGCAKNVSSHACNGEMPCLWCSVNLQTSLVWLKTVVGRFWCLREITQTPQSRKSSWNLFLSCGVLWIGAVGVTFKYRRLVLLENTFSTVCVGENDFPAIFDSLIFLNQLWSSKMRLCQWAFLKVGKVPVLRSREMWFLPFCL